MLNALRLFTRKHARKIVIGAIIVSVMSTFMWIWFLTYPYPSTTGKPIGFLFLLGTSVIALDIAIVCGIVKLNRKDQNENE